MRAARFQGQCCAESERQCLLLQGHVDSLLMKHLANTQHRDTWHKDNETSSQLEDHLNEARFSLIKYPEILAISFCTIELTYEALPG